MSKLQHTVADVKASAEAVINSARDWRTIQEEIDRAFETVENILNTAAKENRNLTKNELAVVEALQGTDKDCSGGILAELVERKEELRTEENARKQIAAARAARGDVKFDEPIHRSNGGKTRMRNHEGQEVVMLSNKESLTDHYKALNKFEVQDCDNPFGELLRTAVCGLNDYTPRSVKNALTSGNNATGGYLVPDSMTPGVIDIARNKSAVIRAGAMTFPMDAPSVLMAQVVQDPTFEVKAENNAFNESTIVLGQRKIEAFTMGTLVKASRELVEDAPNFASLVERIMGLALAVKLDYLTLQGNGGSEPLGLLTSSSTPNSAVGSGSAPEWQDIGDAAIAIRVANYEPNAVLLSPTNHGYFQHLMTGDGTNSAANWLGMPPSLDNQVIYPTGNMPEDKIVVGQWDMLAWGIRQGARVEISTEAGDAFEKHQVFFKITWRGNWVPMDHSAFYIKTGISLS